MRFVLSSAKKAVCFCQSDSYVMLLFLVTDPSRFFTALPFSEHFVYLASFDFFFNIANRISLVLWQSLKKGKPFFFNVV